MATQPDDDDEEEEEELLLQQGLRSGLRTKALIVGKRLAEGAPWCPCRGGALKGPRRSIPPSLQS